jgi:hypothetical protein
MERFDQDAELLGGSSDWKEKFSDKEGWRLE